MSLFEHFYKVLILYLVARIRIRIRIKVTSRIWIRIHIKVTSRMRIRIKVMRIRKCVTNCGGEFHETWYKSELTGLLTGDVSHLAHLSKLDQLTLANNPAIKQPDEIQ
jgi:hypothetical protein